MNKEIIKDELKWLLEAINEQYEAIQEHGDKIPHIEFDILMENVRKFYDDMRLLQRLNEPVVLPEKGIHTGSAAHGETNVVPGAGEIPGHGMPIPVPSRVSTTPVVTVTFSEPEPEAAGPAGAEEPGVPVQAGPVHFKPAGVVTARHETTAASKKPAKMPEIDLFASEEPTFSIKLKEARERSLGPKIPSERIENLKAAISINEKFMFINELFDGNLREYNETVETLNGFKNLDQAADFLDLMRKKNFWNTGSNAFKKLKELVERRF